MHQGTFAGRLGRDSELRSTPSGRYVAKFSLAVSVHKGGGEQETLWVSCSLWGERGQKLAQYLKKGSAVTVTGRIELREWTDRDGKPRTALECNVQDVALQGGGNGQDGGHRGATQARSDQDDFDWKRAEQREAATAGGEPAAGRPPPPNEFDDDIPF